MTGRAVPIAAAAALAGGTTFAFVMAARHALANQAGPEMVPGYPDAVARAPARGMWAYFPQLALAVFLLIVLLSPAGLEPQILAILGAGAVYVLAGTWLAAESAPYAYSTRRLEREKEIAVTQALGGLVRRVWVAPYPLVAGPIGTVATVAGKSLFIWNPLARLEPEEIAAAGAFRAARRRAWPLGIIAVWATVLLEGIKQIHVSRWPIWIVLAISIVAALTSDGRWLRVRRTFASTPEPARAAVAGILAAGREQARLAATGLIPPPKPQLFPSIANLIWQRSMVQAANVAAAAGLEASALSDATHEVVGREGTGPAA